jgi:hypothetical protein
VNDRNTILLELLSDRLAEVESMLLSNDSAALKSTDMIEDREECLRKLMVSILPKVKKVNPSKEKRELFFDLLDDLYFNAASKDIRFFDAFNLGFETILSWNEDYSKHDVQQFLSNYKSLLSHHINLLTP